MSSGRPSRNSLVSRDFPTPGIPRIVARTHERSCDGASEGLTERLELAFASDHRRVEAPGDAEAHCPTSSRRNAATVAVFPFNVSGSTGSATTASRTRLIVGRADQDLAGCRRLLQAGGDVDRIARHERLSGGGVARDDVAGVHADPRRDRHAAVAFELLVQGCEGVAHLDRGPDRPERVVLVDGGYPEDRHHGVADVLLDGAAVALEHRPHLLEEPRHQTAERFRIELLAERRRSRDVTEQDRDGLSNLTADAIHHKRSLGWLV